MLLTRIVFVRRDTITPWGSGDSASESQQHQNPNTPKAFQTSRKKRYIKCAESSATKTSTKTSRQYSLTPTPPPISFYSAEAHTSLHLCRSTTAIAKEPWWNTSGSSICTEGWRHFQKERACAVRVHGFLFRVRAGWRHLRVRALFHLLSSTPAKPARCTAPASFLDVSPN